jgi:cardiolipin synthase
LLVRQLPNLVSASRFVLAPFAVQAILAGDDWRALWLCLAGGATDFLDGWLARSLGETSRSGAILDPLADKFFLDLLYLVLWLERGIWAGALVIARDVMILAGTFWIYRRTGRRDFPPRWAGKVSTVVQIGWIVFYLAAFPGIEWATWILVAATAISGLDYAGAGWRMLREPPRTKFDATRDSG